MPIVKGAKYRYKKGTKIRLAIVNGKVVEAKNMKTGATHTPAEFKADRARSKRHASKKARKASRKGRGK